MPTEKTETGLFDSTNEVVLASGSIIPGAKISKIIITNTDTANITPKIRIYNVNKSGEDDEYIQLMPEIELAPNERIVYGTPIHLLGNQDLVVELSEDVTTSQPQYMVIRNYV